MPDISLRVLPDKIRAWDPKLGGSVAAVISGKGVPRDTYPWAYKASILAACDIGVWNVECNGDGIPSVSELTQELIFSDGKQRRKYNVHQTKVRKDYMIGSETAWTKVHTIPTVSAVELKNVISFGGRYLKRIDHNIFYLTSLGLFRSNDDGQHWVSCATYSSDISYSDDNPELLFRPDSGPPPLSVNDLVQLRADSAGDIFLVGATDGLYILRIDGNRHRWTRLPALYGISCLKLLSPAGTDTIKFLYCMTGTQIFMLTLSFGKTLTCRAEPAVGRSADDKRIDLSKTFRTCRQWAEGPDGLVILVASNGIGVLRRMDADLVSSYLRLGQFTDASILSGVVRPLDGEYFALGEKVTFPSQRAIAIANGQSILLSDVDLRSFGTITFDIGKAPYADEIISSVSQIWGNFVAVGTSQGNVLILEQGWTESKLSTNTSVSDLSERNDMVAYSSTTSCRNTYCWSRDCSPARRLRRRQHQSLLCR